MPLQDVRANDARELKDIADAIAKSHKILVVTGAGISTSCGIPDFRSKDGLYNMFPNQYLPTPPPSQPATPSHKRKASQISNAETPPRKRQAVDTDDEGTFSSHCSMSSRASRRCSSSPTSRMSGQDLFHARVFHRADTTQIFNQFLAGFKQKLRDEIKQTSKTHKFIRALRDGGRLMRCYTQNIDGLEEREGLCVDLKRGKGNKRRFMKKHYELPRPDLVKDTDFDGGCEVVQLHGELSKLRCTVCSTEDEWTEEASDILLQGAAPKCNACSEKSEIRQATGKRGLTVGTLRPNIVLYGEEHPQNMLLSPLVPYDIASGPEILVIMGTSLKVFGMQKIIRDFAKAIHGKKNGRVVFVNRTRPAESMWEGIIDDFVEMDCDDWVDDLRTRRPGLWLRQGEIDLKDTKSRSGKKKRKSHALDTEEEVVASVNVQLKDKVDMLADPSNRKPFGTKQPKLLNEPSTPSSKKESAGRATTWRNSLPPGDLKPLLSPLAKAQRPDASPLTKSFKPFIRSDVENTPLSNRNGNARSRQMLQSSPLAPPYSPLTPTTPRRFEAKTPSRLRIHQDIEDGGCFLGYKLNEINCEHVEDTMLSPKRNLNERLVAMQTDGTLGCSNQSPKSNPRSSSWLQKMVSSISNA